MCSDCLIAGPSQQQYSTQIDLQTLDPEDFAARLVAQFHTVLLAYQRLDMLALEHRKIT